MTSAVPRLLRHEVTKKWIQHPSGWSPHDILAGKASVFLESSSLTVKRSRTSRFFMYEEHANNERVKVKDDNGPTQVIQRSPSEVADLLASDDPWHHYWTSPVASVAPGLLTRLRRYESLHDDRRLLDPRGPSLWMGSSGSATQAHYDVADNVVVQLFGTKRVRCYRPGAAGSLHVFPDAHPRARKSQVNFDEPDRERFPNFSSLPSPALDVVLKPGDALRIPAFWFHHVENGRIPMDQGRGDHHDGPSVSLNIFALSPSMMAAQGIFRDASRPFGFLEAAPGGYQSTDESAAERHYEFAVVALRALGWGLLEGLGVQGSPGAFIRTSLLDARYAPLRRETMAEPVGSDGGQHTKKLTTSDEADVAKCLARVLPQFASLRIESGEDDDEIVHLVALHLLELWAVEFVGASAVADAWDSVLLLDN